jgi:hypothetical protein
MATAILLVCCVVCVCSSMSAGIMAFPLPATKSVSEVGYELYKQVAEGRIPISRKEVPMEVENQKACKEQCSSDFTCKGFSNWSKKKNVFETINYCLKIKEATFNPFIHSKPAWIGGEKESKIFMLKDTSKDVTDQ